MTLIPVYSTHPNLLGNINSAQKRSFERDGRTKGLCFSTLRNLAFQWKRRKKAASVRVRWCRRDA